MLGRIRRPRGKTAKYYRGWLKAVGEMWREHKPKPGTFNPKMARGPFAALKATRL